MFARARWKAGPHGRRGAKLGIGGLCLALWAGPALAACSEDAITLRDGKSVARFNITVADDDAERARGLMFVEDMPASTGMLFVYDRPGTVSFWMRNTLIPLDMVFIGPDGVVDKVHSNAIPLDETPIFGGRDIQYVLEINGGLAERLGIAAGTQVQHPAIDPALAILPCE